MKPWMGAIVGLVLQATVLSAQIGRATLTGPVRDSSAGVIQRASITVTNIATGVQTRLATTDEGTYLAVDLAPGEFLVEASASGFQTVAQPVLLAVGQRGRLDFTLTVGNVEQVIRV